MSENVVIVGPGRMGLALGAALVQARAVDRLIFYGRGMEPPPHPIFEPAVLTAEYRIGPHPVPSGTTILILAVPESALSEVSYDLSRAGQAPLGCAAFHLSGALSTEVLSPLHAVGYTVASLHPLQAVADPWRSGDRLMGSAFGIAGEPAALAAARRLIAALGGRALLIPPARRPVYHAGAVVASNYLVALVSFAVRLLGQAGIPEEEAVPALLPLIRGTLDNLEQLGVPAALTGPIPRGDIDIVRLHLARLSEEDRVLYSALARELLHVSRLAGLNQQRADELEALLEQRGLER